MNSKLSQKQFAFRTPRTSSENGSSNLAVVVFSIGEKTMFEDLAEIFKTKVAQIDVQKGEAQAMLKFVESIEKLATIAESKENMSDLVGRLVDQVDHLSKEINDLKSQVKSKTDFIVELPNNDNGSINALDSHARTLIEIMAERPGRYTTSEMVDMLGLNKTTVINVMKRALDLDPEHVKMSQGKRRKLYISYTPNKHFEPSKPMNRYGSDTDMEKLELMAMT